MTLSPEEQARIATRIGELDGIIARQADGIREWERTASSLGKKRGIERQGNINAARTVLEQQREEANVLRARIGLPLVVSSPELPSPMPAQTGLGFGRGLAIVSILLIMLGCFVPIMSFAFDNSSVTLFKGGTGDGVVFIVLMVVAVFLAVARQGLGVVIVGLLSLLLCLWSLRTTGAVLRGLASDPACLPSVCASTWGPGYLLVLGGSVLLMLTGGSMGRPKAP